MGNSKTLSIMPYYGGKARMAKFIVERLNYDDSDIYIEPFGGACRVLLNKPRHKVEIYNDYGEGVCAVMRMLSNPETARDFIYELLETEYSEEEFSRAKAIYDDAENDLLQLEEKKLTKKLLELSKKYGLIKEKDNMSSLENLLKDETSLAKLTCEIKKDKDYDKIIQEFKPILKDYYILKEAKDKRGFLERTRDMSTNPVSDMELAKATYIVFTQSRNGMGKTWGKNKFKSTMYYHNQMKRLFDCAERLEGITINEIDATSYFNCDGFIKWINNQKVMAYCDPSYINPESEAKLLEDIDWEHEENLSLAIKKKIEEREKEIERIKKQNKQKGQKIKQKLPKNLGELYTMSFSYEDHENFLKLIQKAKCKIMVSNYDIILYNKYLTPKLGWKRFEYETNTSIGGKKDNRRLEVLWYNY